MQNKLILVTGHESLIQLIELNYSVKITNIKILIDHTYSKVYLLESPTGKYALKEMGENRGLEDEGLLNKHLISNGIKVPKIYCTTTAIATTVEPNRHILM